MITEIYRRPYNKDKSLPLDRDQDCLTLHIADMHGEYVLPTDAPKTEEGFRARISCVINYSALEELMGEEETTEYLLHMPKKLQDVYGSEMVDVWSLAGSYNQLLWVFNEFAHSLFANETGGDDDTFDYWPSAMTVAWQIACDLDEAVPEGDVRGLLKIGYSAFVQEFGEVMEYTPDWENEVTHG
jgi:hypothetical protein